MIDAEALPDFLNEAGELVEVLQNGLLALETAADAERAESIQNLFRAAHSIKGAAGMVGLSRTAELTHALEDLLDAIRAGKSAVNVDIVDALFAGADCLTILVAAIANGEGEAVETEDAIATLKAFLPQGDGGSSFAASTLPVSPEVKALLTEMEELNLFVAEHTGRAVFEGRIRGGELAAAGIEPRAAAHHLEALGEVVALVRLDAPGPVAIETRNDADVLFGVLLATGMDETALRAAAPWIGELRLLDKEKSVAVGRLTAMDSAMTMEAQASACATGRLGGLGEIQEMPGDRRSRVAPHGPREGAPASMHPLPSGEQSQYLALFLDESADEIERLAAALLSLEESFSPEAVHEAFRYAHRLKGGAAAMGFRQLADLCHRLEDLLDAIRAGRVATPPAVVSLLLETSDAIRNSLETIRSRGIDDAPVALFEKRIDALLGDSGTKEPSICESSPDLASGGPASSRAANRNADSAPCGPRERESSQGKTLGDPGGLQGEKKRGEKASPAPAAAKQPQSIRVDLDKLDALMNLAGELVVLRAQFQRHADSLARGLGKKEILWSAEDLARRAEESSSPELAAACRRHLERLHGLRDPRADAAELKLSAQQLLRVSTAIQNGVMSARMLAVAQVFNRFPRLVRDLSRQFGKEVGLEVSGEETELDKRVIDELGDPLTHLIRNALDHGIEPPEERAAVGKPAAARLELAAFREGNMVCIRIGDDGRGIDRARVLAKARERGLVATEATPDDDEILRLIFLPGFSTAAAVSDVSGRGVGMDIVKSRIEELKGSIELASTAGAGTTVTLRIPLTLSILKALLVEDAGATLAIPAEQIVEIARLGADAVKTIEGRPVSLVRDQVLSVLDLAPALGLADRAGASRPFALVIHAHPAPVVFRVERLLGEEEVVVKGLPDEMAHVEGLSGATILGDGRVALIMDATGQAGRIARRRREGA